MKLVILRASNGKIRKYKTKENFNVLFKDLKGEIFHSNYFFKTQDFFIIENKLQNEGLTALDAMRFVLGGLHSDIFQRDTNKSLDKLPYFHWDNAYQFINDNATEEDFYEWMRKSYVLN